MLRILFAFLFIVLQSCTQSTPNRPTQLPNNAIWKGGSDGGCWIVFNSFTESALDVVVYHEDGDSWDKGIFIKEGNCLITKDKVFASIIGFDGTSLLTYDKCTFNKK